MYICISLTISEYEVRDHDGKGNFLVEWEGNPGHDTWESLQVIRNVLVSSKKWTIFKKDSQ